MRSRTDSARWWTAGAVAAALAAAVGAAGCQPNVPSPAAQTSDSPVVVGVPDRANANVSMATASGPDSASVVALAWSAAGDQGPDVFAAVSTDGGTTFGEPVRVNDEPGTAKMNPETPPRVAVARRGGAIDVAVSWTSTVDGTTIRLARSTDGGRTFSASSALSAPGAPGNRGWHAMSGFDAAGRVALVWLDHRDMAPVGAVPEHDADPETHGSTDGAAMAQRSQLYFAEAAPDGASVEQPVVRGVCYCCKTSVALDPQGAVYAAWRQVYPGNIRDIAFAVARDGRTFEAPVRVSDDEWELNGCPEDGPSLVVDPDGAAHVAWPTVVTSANGEPRKTLFFASSGDGRSFTPREALPTDGSPDHPQLARAADGALIVAWDELTGGTRRIALAVRAPGGTFIRRPLAGEPNGRYPVVAPAGDGWAVAWAAADGHGVMVQRVGR
jgi:hypothetical protein